MRRTVEVVVPYKVVRMMIDGNGMGLTLYDCRKKPGERTDGVVGSTFKFYKVIMYALLYIHSLEHLKQILYIMDSDSYDSHCGKERTSARCVFERHSIYTCTYIGHPLVSTLMRPT